MKAYFKLIFFIVIICLSYLNVYSQNRDVDINNFVDDVKFKMTVDGKEHIEAEYTGIKGTPYLNKKFDNGTVYMQGDKIYKILLRYNAYKDKFEFQIKNKTYIISNPSKVHSILLNDKEYCYILSNSNNETGSYYEILKKGKSLLLFKIKKGIKEGKPIHPITLETTPPEFIIVAREYYTTNSYGELFRIKNNSDILECYSDKYDEIQKFIKKHRIKARKLKHIKKVVTYYNSL